MTYNFKVTSDDTTRIPHSFWQNNMNKNNCIIVNYATGEELPAKPKDCVGLEKVSVYPAFEVVERINHFLNGKSTESYPGNEVIL